MQINLEENKYYIIKPSTKNNFGIGSGTPSTEYVEIKIEKLSDSGKYAKIVLLLTDQKPKTLWTLVNNIQPILIDVINYPINY